MLEAASQWCYIIQYTEEKGFFQEQRGPAIIPRFIDQKTTEAFYNWNLT
jgi:hypothetical protein